MLDLDSIIEKAYRFKLEGKLINVNQPTVAMVKKFSSLAKIEDQEEILDKQVELVAEILNNNTSAAKFTREQLLKYPQAVLNAIIEEISRGIAEADNNPN